MRRITAYGNTSTTAIALVAILCAAPAGAAPRLLHDPPIAAVEGLSVAVEVTVAGEFALERLATADVVVLGASGPVRVSMSVHSRNSLAAEIPSRLVARGSISYYFQFVDADGDEALLPAGAPEAGTFVVEVFADSEDRPTAPAVPEVTPGVEIIAPAPGEVVMDVRPVAAVVFDPPLDGPFEALALLDGVDATAAADVGPDGFVLASPESLADGPHTVTLAVLTESKQVEAAWTFYVRRRERPGGGGPFGRGEPGPGELAFRSGEWDDGTAWSDAAAPRFELHGRVEVGWAAVAAETTATESVDVFLPYDEISRPTIDAYVSGDAGARRFLLTAQYDPVYSDDLAWSASVGTGRFDLEVGDVYPALSRTTLDWAVGQGAVVKARLGRTTTEVVAMRVSEADTAGGFGIYSRFALGAKESLTWGERSSAALVYTRAFDREGSVADDQQLTDPLENDVVAGVASFGLGDVTVALEAAGSRSSGEVGGSGGAVVARLGYALDHVNRFALEYVASDASFYSAGSLELEPGEKGVKGEFSTRALGAVALSGYAGVYRHESSAQGEDPDEYELQTYGRADAAGKILGGDLRGYAVVRYDRVPYETHDYRYVYAMAGVSYRRGRTRGALSGSWSRSDYEEWSDVWTAGGEALFDLIPRTWSLRLNGRMSFGSGEDGSDEYTRTSLIAETRLTGDGHELTAEYRLLDRNDENEPSDSYTEHIVRIGVARAF